MRLINSTETLVKKSKFKAYYYFIDNIGDIEKIMINLKKENKKANHFSYAYKINNLVKKSDDKEPKNTAGNPILNIIEKKELNNVLIVVVRYFGGIKLGTGGLCRAYGNSANIVTK